MYKRLHKNRSRASREWADKATVYVNGIDRIDNSKNYTPNNCVPCCEVCNKAKRHLSYVEFKNWIQRLIDNNSLGLY